MTDEPKDGATIVPMRPGYGGAYQAPLVAHDNIVHALEELLEQAQEGRIVSLAVVYVEPRPVKFCTQIVSAGENSATLAGIGALFYRAHKLAEQNIEDAAK